MNEILALFKAYTGKEAVSIEEIKNSGSNRRYYRLSNDTNSCIGVSGTSPEEGKAFVALSINFRKKGLPVPEVYSSRNDCLAYIQEDMGNKSLFEAIKNGRETGVFSEKEKELLKKTIAKLPDFQFKGAEGLDFSVCFPQPEFDKRTVFWDLNYFKYCFLKNTGLEFREDLLESDFEEFAKILLREKTDTFMYRDFQSRNVMIRDENPYFIDFQGGRKGPIYYDIASFLWQAKARYPGQLKEELLQTYFQAASQYTAIDAEAFRSRLNYFVLFRTLQVLGAYGFRGYIEKKAHFIESIPYAVANLKALIGNNFPECPYLISILRKVVESERFRVKEKTAGLTVRIYSFSYKNGIPEDYSGNGGGYVFDCRAIHNPGRYEAYKLLNGLDEPVIDFLEENKETPEFMEKVYGLAGYHVERYLERGFTDLMFSFGCTGGQHRSVYAAQHLATFLQSKYRINIQLEHRELQIKSTINN